MQEERFFKTKNNKEISVCFVIKIQNLKKNSLYTIFNHSIKINQNFTDYSKYILHFQK